MTKYNSYDIYVYILCSTVQLTINIGHSGQAAGGGIGKGDPPPTETTSGICKQENHL